MNKYLKAKRPEGVPPAASSNFVAILILLLIFIGLFAIEYDNAINNSTAFPTVIQEKIIDFALLIYWPSSSFRIILFVLGLIVYELLRLRRTHALRINRLVENGSSDAINYLVKMMLKLDADIQQTHWGQRILQKLKIYAAHGNMDAQNALLYLKNNSNHARKLNYVEDLKSDAYKSITSSISYNAPLSILSQKQVWKDKSEYTPEGWRVLTLYWKILWRIYTICTSLVLIWGLYIILPAEMSFVTLFRNIWLSDWKSFIVLFKNVQLDNWSYEILKLLFALSKTDFLQSLSIMGVLLVLIYIIFVISMATAISYIDKVKGLSSLEWGDENENDKSDQHNLHWTKLLLKFSSIILFIMFSIIFDFISFILSRIMTLDQKRIKISYYWF